MQAALPQNNHFSADSQISSAAAHGVRAPLAALRASMEALAHGLDSTDPRSTTLRGALDEVVRLGHEMQTLLDYALPLALQPMSCSLREIVCSAVDGVGPARRASVWVAVENRRARLEVDGPLLSRTLSRLIDCAVADAQGPVLLRARVDGADAVFAVVQGEVRASSGADSCLKSTSVTSMLGLVLARRDAERMGGSFTFRRGENGRIVSEIRFQGSATATAA
jgi:K+-sensing histidine kinase KdpD